MGTSAPRKIEKVEDLVALEVLLMKMLDQGQISEAVEFAETLEGEQALVARVQALVFTEAGSLAGDAAFLQRGAEGWRKLSDETDPTVSYNLANAELELWNLACKGHRYVTAFETAHQHLRKARDLFEQVGWDAECPTNLRVQALTNLGNSFDNLGREHEAYRCWSEATRLDPSFGMAHGNVGVALAHVAGLLNQHAPTARLNAALALDKALADRERVLHIGGPVALERFEKTRAELPSKVSPAEPAVEAPWADPYLEWCRRNELFLHLSPSCQREDDGDLDPLYISRFSSGLDPADEERAKNVFDAFNATKQDYLAARYSTWLAIDPASPIHAHSTAVSARATFLDTLEYGRWGVRTGMATSAFAAATNVLDKIANFVHLYFGTARRHTDVYFRSIWYPRSKQGKMDQEFVEAIEPPRGNRGLIALFDLACELERETRLAEFVNQRHTATHRFLVVHALDPAISSNERLDRVVWGDLIEASIEQLAITRAAIIYLARTIDINEALIAHSDEREGRARAPLTFPRVDSDLAEID